MQLLLTLLLALWLPTTAFAQERVARGDYLSWRDAGPYEEATQKGFAIGLHTHVGFNHQCGAAKSFALHGHSLQRGFVTCSQNQTRFGFASSSQLPRHLGTNTVRCTCDYYNFHSCLRIFCFGFEGFYR